MPIVAKSRLQGSPASAALPIPRPEIQPRARTRRPTLEASPPAEMAVAPVVQTTSERPASSQDEVGYKKPPRHSQFKKGESGNRKGRPKGAKGMSTIVRNVLTKKVIVRSASGSERMSKMEAIVHKTAEKSFGGDMRAIQSAMKLYAQYVPDEPVTAAARGMPDDVPAADMDAHDRAILDAFRRKLREEDEES